MSVVETNLLNNYSINTLPNSSTVTQKTTINPNAVDKTPVKDTVLIGGKTYKKKNFWLVAGGTLLTAAAATAAILLTRGVKGCTLPSHITFNPANTVEDAIKYGQDVLGIKVYHGISNLDHLNYINESLAHVSNVQRGKCRMPSVIIDGSEVLSGRKAFACMTENGHCGIKGHTLGINLNFIERLDEFMPKVVNKLQKEGLIYKSPSDNSLQLRDIINDEAKLKLESLLNNKSKSFKDKIALYEGLNEYYDVATCTTSSQIKGNITVSPYLSIAHELGHAQHEYSAGLKNYKQMDKLNAVLDNGGNTAVINDFLSSKEKQNIARQVSRYATESPLEFIAEVFARVTAGKRFSGEVMDLYAQYKGPELFL